MENTQKEKEVFITETLLENDSLGRYDNVIHYVFK